MYSSTDTHHKRKKGAPIPNKRKGGNPLGRYLHQGSCHTAKAETYILERYRYLVKVKAYLATGQPEKAMSLIERLELYFEAHRRTYNKIT